MSLDTLHCPHKEIMNLSHLFNFLEIAKHLSEKQARLLVVGRKVDFFLSFILSPSISLGLSFLEVLCKGPLPGHY